MQTSLESNTEAERLTSRISELEQENANLRLLDQAIKRNIAMFEALLARSSDGIALLGPDRTIVRVVRTALGFSGDEVAGLPLEAIVHPADRRILIECCDQLLERQAQSVEFEGRICRPDGTVRWVMARLTDLLDDPNVHAIVCNYRDVTRERTQDLALAELAVLINGADGAVFSEDPGGHILTWNAGTQRLFGYRTEEIAGGHIHALVPPELREEEFSARQRVVEGGESTQFLTVRIHKDGSRIGVLAELTPVTDRYGRPRGIVCWSQLAPMAAACDR